MRETENHGYNVPEQGDEEWHEPVNENFEGFEVDIEVRDEAANRDEYEPTEGSKFLAVDTGVVYLGDGTDWNETFSFGGDGNGSAVAGRYLTGVDQLDFAGPAEWENDGETETNEASDDAATVAGGEENTASGQYSSVSGGRENSAESLYTAVGGGRENVANGFRATVAGGGENVVDSSGGVVGGGRGNEVTGSYATVAGGGGALSGDGNTASESYTAIAGGRENEASESYGVVGGGRFNVASGNASAVSGGWDNAASDPNTTVAGGRENVASTEGASVGGGEGNEADDSYATVGGGEHNEASAEHATVGGGEHNEASAEHATVGGGEDNSAFGDRSTVAGGADNVTTAESSTIGGGDKNDALAAHSTVSGGTQNAAEGLYATVPGGYSNTASGNYSFASGRDAQAEHDGSFVWADSRDSTVGSTDPDQFLIEARRGVGIGTVTPRNDLRVHIKRRDSADGGNIVMEDADTDTGIGLRATYSGGEAFPEGPYLQFTSYDSINEDTFSSDLASILSDGSYHEGSDRRLKQSIEQIDGILADVCSLEPVTYQRKNWDEDSEHRKYGFIAQAVKRTFPKLVSGDEDTGHLSLDYSKFGVLAIQAIKEQQSIIETCQETIDVLEHDSDVKEERLDTLEEKNERLETAIEDRDSRLEELEAENEELRERLATIEEQLQLSSTESPTTATSDD